MTSRTWTLLLWGDTQVGKTTLLTTAVYGDAARCPPAIDAQLSADALASTLQPHWNLLRTSRRTRPTSENLVDLQLTTRAKNTLRLRDVRGGMTRQVQHTWAVEPLKQADAVLFLIEWGSTELSRQMAAIHDAWNFCVVKPKALAFTKCEWGLDECDPAWRRRRGWWRAAGASWEGHEPLIEQFGDAVFPTSAYGYNARTGTAALILDELGGFVPFGIRPRGVAEPFQFLLQALGVT